MSRTNLPITWHEDFELPGIGLYFVAVRYPNGFGAYDFIFWDGEQWEISYTADIVGWVKVDEFISSFDAGWPEGDKEISREFAEHYEARKRGQSDDDDFVEV